MHGGGLDLIFGTLGFEFVSQDPKVIWEVQKSSHYIMTTAAPLTSSMAGVLVHKT